MRKDFLDPGRIWSVSGLRSAVNAKDVARCFVCGKRIEDRRVDGKIDYIPRWQTNGRIVPTHRRRCDA